MKLSLLLGVSAVYMMLIGIGHLLAPVYMSAGAVPADASGELVAFLRHYAALFIAIAVLNWLVRKVEVSVALHAILVANIIVFGLGAALDVAAVVGGAGLTGLLPASINLLFALAFVWVLQGSHTARSE